MDFWRRIVWMTVLWIRSETGTLKNTANEQSRIWFLFGSHQTPTGIQTEQKEVGIESNPI